MRGLLFLPLVAWAVLAPAQAQNLVTAYRIDGGTEGNQDFGGSLGMDFVAVHPITVTQLGVFDDASDGLTRPITVQIWSRADGDTPEVPNDDAGLAVLTEALFSPDSRGVLDGGSRFKALAEPLELPPGAYTIAAFGYGDAERNGNGHGQGPFGSVPGADDLALLAGLGAVAAGAGGPFIGSAQPALFGCSLAADLPEPRQWLPLAGDAALRWSALRHSALAEWIGLVAPRLLMRLPYGKATDPTESFAFEEQPATPLHDTLLWGQGSLAVALLAGQAFTESGWDLEPGQVQDVARPARLHLQRGRRGATAAVRRSLVGRACQPGPA